MNIKIGCLLVYIRTHTVAKRWCEKYFHIKGWKLRSVSKIAAILSLSWVCLDIQQVSTWVFIAQNICLVFTSEDKNIQHIEKASLTWGDMTNKNKANHCLFFNTHVSFKYIIVWSLEHIYDKWATSIQTLVNLPHYTSYTWHYTFGILSNSLPEKHSKLIYSSCYHISNVRHLRVYFTLVLIFGLWDPPAIA